LSFPNVSDIVATTIQSRSRKIADSVTDNNALLKRMNQRGNIKTASGGNLIYQELSYAENGNAGWYSGYDVLPIGASDVITAAEFSWKQAAVPVVISGLEQLQNSGKEQMIDLLESRISVAESTMANLLSEAIYSDGTGNGGKEITGLNAAVPTDPTTGTYGGINRATWTFWRSLYASGTTATAANIISLMNDLYVQLCRGADHPDLIIADNNMYTLYLDALQAQQRFTSTDMAQAGFPTIKYMNSDVMLDGGIGGNMPANTMFFLNTKYIHYRPHAQRNIVPLSPNKRHAINQDAEVQIMAWAGNMTTSGAKFQGRLNGA
jgi:hypothetical protein